MSFDTQDYIDLFYQDAEEHLQIMTDALLDMEKDPSNREALDSLFRSAHTMKSSSAMVGFMHVSEFTHRMEDLIDYLRTENIQIDVDTVNLLFKSFDVLKDMLAHLQDQEIEATKNETKHKADDLIKMFTEILEGEKSLQDAVEKEVSQPRVRMNEETRLKVEELRLSGNRIYEITVKFIPEVQMASTRAFLIINNLNRHGTVIQTAPDLSDDDQEIGVYLSLLYATEEEEQTIEHDCSVAEVESVEVREVTKNEQFEWPEEQEQPSTEEKQEASQEPKEVTTSFDRREDNTKVQTVRVSIDKLDRLLNLAAEMVIQRGRAQELSQQLMNQHGKGGTEEEMLNTILQQGMFLTQLQETIMDARMVPIGTVFARFRRVVRDLSHNRGKSINLILEGEETELDKKIIDQIGDPLMHMVRNSVDHGVETPEERKAAGKPVEGLLHLNASHIGNHIVISIKDDGKGLDPELLKKKALEKGVISHEEADSLSTGECYQLIFRPGFSTAQEVTDISGRGVGMDVVRRSIEQLGGSVEIESEIGVGTTFFIKLPLTLAIIQALLVECNEEMYAIPISHISETIRIERKAIFTVEGKGEVIRLRDQVVPLLNLKNVVEMEDQSVSEDKLYIAVIKNGNMQVGLIVDRMVNEEEIVIKSLSGELNHAPYIAGAAILGNGRVILILDTVSLIETTLLGTKKKQVAI